MTKNGVTVLAKHYPYLAIGAVVLAYLFIAISIALSPWFNWYNNALSDLGNTSLASNVSSGAAYIFDGGLIISGVMTVMFSVFLMRDAGFSWKYLIWAIPLALASLDLTCIGIFNESFGNIHLVVSVIFFFMTALTLFLYSYVSFPIGTPKIGAFSLVLGVVCSAFWVTRFPWHGVAIQETATSVASAMLVLTVAVQILKKPAIVGSKGNSSQT